MITIKNVKTPEGQIKTHTIPSDINQTLDARGRLTILPSLIDPHVHFRTPGSEHKENWVTGAQAAISGGVTTVFDMPNNSPSCISLERLIQKKEMIEFQLAEAQIPLRYHLYLGADQNHLDEINKARKHIIGVKVYMGSSTGDLLMANKQPLDQVFQLCAQENLIVSVHAEDQGIITQKSHDYSNENDPSVHSKIRDRAAAIKATSEAIELASKHDAQLFVLHVSTKEEISLIRQAKQSSLLVYAEVAPHHLLLNEEAYKSWGSLVQVNPPLRTREDQEALWEGILDNTVDVIGSDHAPHTLQEKQQTYGKSPSGIPGIELTLPLLLNAHNEGKITLEKLILLTHQNIIDIFRLPPIPDVVLVDLDLIQEVQDETLKTKCRWSPYKGMTLKGWPIYTILKGRIYNVQ